MKQGGSLAFFDFEFQNQKHNQIERKKSPFKQHQPKGELICYSPQQGTLNTLQLDQPDSQVRVKSMTYAKKNSSAFSLSNLITQAQLNQITNQAFHEKYEILKILKENKQCQIVQCRNIATKEYVMAKICLELNRFEIKREFEVSKTLQKCPHPNLMKLLEMFVNKDTHVFIYEYMHGGTLFEYMQQKQLTIDELEIKAIFKQILKALKHLNSLNIIHRDLKLDNIMFKEKGNIKSIKLIDFGYTTFLSDSLGMQQRCGTPGYMAPEIYDSKLPYNELCDIYSLAAVIHILATGQRIYSSKFSQKQICEFNQLNQYEISKNLKCPLLRNLITQMLQTEASQRPPVEKCLTNQYFYKLSKQTSQEQINQQIYTLQFPQFKNPFKSFQQCK